MMFKKILFIALLAFFSQTAFAQFELGASYELRDEDPQSGFGVRVQTGILNKIPLFNLGIRFHASYFDQENSVDLGGNLTYSENFTNFDYGVAVVGGVPVGLVEAYVGVGLGSESVDFTLKNTPIGVILPEEEKESNIYWNTFIGAKVKIIPLVKPFVEYRFTSRDLEIPNMDDKTGRIIFGVVLSL